MPQYNIPEKLIVASDSILNANHLILLDEKEADQAELQLLLDKIISALLGANSSQSAKMTIAENEVFPIRNFSGSDTKVWIGFGIKPSQLGLQGFEQLYEYYQWKNHHLIFCKPLREYVNSDLNKKQLWAALQQIKNT